MAVVLVEDHDNLRAVLTMALSEMGFDVIALTCAEEVDEVAGVRPAEAYVIDLNLPGEDGISLVKRLRASEANAFIVVVTARTEIPHRVVGYESGADIYLPKPVAPEELAALLHAHVGRVRSRAVLDADFQVDTARNSLIGPQGQVKLTAFETQVLTALAGARNQRLEYWQLLGELHPNTNTLNMDSLHVRMSRLRTKFREIGAPEDMINSERGLGYKLCIPIQVV